jgi:hypothetical protein
MKIMKSKIVKTVVFVPRPSLRTVILAIPFDLNSRRSLPENRMSISQFNLLWYGSLLPN